MNDNPLNSTEDLMINIEANKNNLNMPISGRLAASYKAQELLKQQQYQKKIMDNYALNTI